MAIMRMPPPLSWTGLRGRLGGDAAVRGREALVDDALGLRHDVLHEVLAGRDVVDEALALANRPDAAVEIAAGEHIGPAARASHEVADVFDRLRRIGLDLD